MGRAQVVSALLRIADGVTRGEIDGAATAKRLRALADRIDSGKTAAAKPAAGPTPEVVAIFEFWQRQMGHPTSKLTPGRRSKIEARLREYPAEKLKRAIVGCSGSGFHNGTDRAKNPTGTRHDGLELILRNGENVERFANYAGAGAAPMIEGASDVLLAEIERLQDDAMEALGRGDQREYERLEKRLTDLRAEGRRADAEEPGESQG